MVRAALGPSTDTTQIALQWLERYFDSYGDKSPNSVHTKINVNFKSDLYEKYKAETKSNGKFVQKSRFYELWNVLFPYCLKRPWCNVPGKCDTCALIDQARAKYSDAATNILLQRCHAMHRGGLFNLERQQ